MPFSQEKTSALWKKSKFKCTFWLLYQQKSWQQESKFKKRGEKRKKIQAIHMGLKKCAMQLVILPAVLGSATASTESL